MKNESKIYKIIGIIIGIAIIIGGSFFAYKKLIEKEKKPEEKIIDKSPEPNKTGQKTITPLLYEVTKEGSNNKMYLFGSIHAADLNNTTFADYILNAFNNSHYVACEVDIIAYQEDTQKMYDDALNMLYTDGTTIKDHLSNETYNKMVKLLTDKKLYTQLYDNYKPYFFESLITNAMIKDAKLSAEDGIDNYFLKKAKDDKKIIIEVESYDYQSNLLSSYSDSFYDILIKEAIDEYDKEVQQLSNMYRAWAKGDYKTILKEASDELKQNNTYSKEINEEIKKYNQELITNRNNEMTKKAIEYFNNNQDVFFMVGILHIIGDDGIAKNLQNQGFSVKEITFKQ